jgi:hypothetical protein
VRRFVAALAVAMGVTVVLSGTAAARGVPQSSGDYCAVNLDTGAVACVDDAADADSAKAEVLGTRSRGQSVLASYLIGRFYDNANFNTAAGYIDFFGSSPCDATLTPRNFGWSPMGSWANRVSSFQGYSNCLIRVWSNTGYTGSNLSYRANEDNLGATMNDNTESVEFS